MRWISLAVVCVNPQSFAAETTKESGAPPQQTYDRILPLRSQAAIDRGYDVPLPFGVSVTFWQFADDLVLLDDLELLIEGDSGAPVDFVELGKSRITTQTVQLNLDTFVLPYLNVFAFVGKYTSEIDITLSAVGSEVAGYLDVACREPPTQADLCGLTFSGKTTLDSDGTTYGVGSVLYFGARPFFGLVSASYSWKESSTLDKAIETLNILPRVGRVFELGAKGQLAPYVGAIYSHTSLTLTGSLSLTAGSRQDLGIDFSVNATSAEDWSGVAGLAWRPNSRWSLRAETAFLNGKSGFQMDVSRRF